MRILIIAVVLALLAAGAPWTTTSSAASPAVATRAIQTATSPAPESAESVSADLAQATDELADLASTYRLLDGVTVTIGATPEGHQAVSYYESGAIVISPDRSVSIDDILEHEIWHVIDWRDNGCIDWGEQIPPSDVADYML